MSGSVNGNIMIDGTSAVSAADDGGGENSAAVSYEIGDVDGDIIRTELENIGSNLGCGDAAERGTVGGGARLCSVFEDTVVEGDIANRGEIIGSSNSPDESGCSIEIGVNPTGNMIKDGLTACAGMAIDVGGRVLILNNSEIKGDILLSDGGDTLDSRGGIVDGAIAGRAGDDRIFAGNYDDLLVGGAGDDVIIGGEDGLIFADRSHTDFTIVIDGDGSFVVADSVSGDTDVLTVAEFISCADEDGQLDNGLVA